MLEESESQRLKGFIRELINQLTDPLQILTSTQEALELELSASDGESGQFERYFELQKKATDDIQRLLHRARPAVQLPAELGDNDPSPALGAKVLVVESNEEALNSITTLFSLMGAEVSGALTAKQAFTMLSRRSDFDYIFADEFLTDSEGAQFLKDVRNEYDHTGATVFIQWPSLEKGEQSSSEEDHVLYKPFGRREINDVLVKAKPSTESGE